MQSGKIFLSEFVTVVHAKEKRLETFLRYADVEYFGERKNAEVWLYLACDRKTYLRVLNRRFYYVGVSKLCQGENNPLQV